MACILRFKEDSPEDSLGGTRFPCASDDNLNFPTPQQSPDLGIGKVHFRVCRHKLLQDLLLLLLV